MAKLLFSLHFSALFYFNSALKSNKAFKRQKSSSSGEQKRVTLGPMNSVKGQNKHFHLQLGALANTYKPDSLVMTILSYFML